jgi:hypothetical protein
MVIPAEANTGLEGTKNRGLRQVIFSSFFAGLIDFALVFTRRSACDIFQASGLKRFLAVTSGSRRRMGLRMARTSCPKPLSQQIQEIIQ